MTTSNVLAVIAIVATLAGVGGADAAFREGNELFEQCQDYHDARNDTLVVFHSGLCSGYIAGVADALQERLCLPSGSAGVTTEQVVDVVVLWLRDHPEKRHLPASDLVVTALKEKFPCN